MTSNVNTLKKEFGIIGRDAELALTLTAAQSGKHILLEGPVGVGKTTIALAVAGHLKRQFVRIDGDERYTEQKLAGWYDPPLVLKMGYTEDSFIHGPLSTAMLQGHILVINELNRMPEGTQNVLLSAMDEKSVVIPKHGKIEALDGFLIIATQNPDEYIGTSQMSEALRDRFICVSLAYQGEDEEREIVRGRSCTEDCMIINTSVAIVRSSRNHPEIQRGSSIRGAIDLADLFATAFTSFRAEERNWGDFAVPALATKVEINDHSNEKLATVIRELVHKALHEVVEQKSRVSDSTEAASEQNDCNEQASLPPETDLKKKVTP